jgi:hypothetical protein
MREDNAEQIVQQQELLATYRRTWAGYLVQQAMHGTAYAPPVLLHGIQECRNQI